MWVLNYEPLLDDIMRHGEIQEGGFRCPAHLVAEFEALLQHTAVEKPVVTDAPPPEPEPAPKVYVGVGDGVYTRVLRACAEVKVDVGALHVFITCLCIFKRS